MESLQCVDAAQVSVRQGALETAKSSGSADSRLRSWLLPREDEGRVKADKNPSCQVGLMVIGKPWLEFFVVFWIVSPSRNLEAESTPRRSGSG